MKITLEQMMISGIHFGHPTRHWHPKIAAYTYGIRNGSHLIDLVKTRKQLKEAQRLVTRVRREGKEILFVGTKKQSSQRIKERAQSSKSFFVRERWLGGILTNWFTVQASLLQLHRLERDKKEGPWESLPKKRSKSFSKTIGTIGSLSRWTKRYTIYPKSCDSCRSNSRNGCYSRVSEIENSFDL
jgi:small subunit ribosomal protein S2